MSSLRRSRPGFHVLAVFCALLAAGPAGAEQLDEDAAGVWSAAVGGLRGRLLVSLEDLRPGLRHKIILEWKNLSLKPLAVTNQPRLTAELTDWRGRAVPTAGFSMSGGIPDAQWAVIPRDAHLGFRVDMQTVGVPAKDEALLALGGKTWGLKPGHYVLKAELTCQQQPGPENQWLGRLDLPPVRIVVTRSRLRRIVISQEDEDAVRRLLDEFLRHTRSPKIMASSRIEPYLDCPPREELLKHGWKAVPYLIEQVARKEAVDAYVGAALIPKRRAKTVEEVYEYNRSRRQKVEEETLPGFALDVVLHQLPCGRDPHPFQRPGIVGYHYNESFKWTNWWQANQHRFEFKTKRPPVIPPPKDRHSSIAQIEVGARDGLLDIYAVSATYQQIIERATREMGIEVEIGEQRYIDVITTIRMKSVTFEEFLHMLGRNVYIKGFDYRKIRGGYHVGQ
jgi:hypothetical protein